MAAGKAQGSKREAVGDGKASWANGSRTVGDHSVGQRLLSSIWSATVYAVVNAAVCPLASESFVAMAGDAKRCARCSAGQDVTFGKTRGVVWCWPISVLKPEGGVADGPWATYVIAAAAMRRWRSERSSRDPLTCN